MISNNVISKKDKINILGINIDNITSEDVLDRICFSIKDNDKLTIIPTYLPY